MAKNKSNARPHVKDLMSKGTQGRKTRREEIKDLELHKKASSYLCDNFHKFNDETRLKVAMELVKKFGVSTVKQDIKVEDLTKEQRTALEGLFADFSRN